MADHVVHCLAGVGLDHFLLLMEEVAPKPSGDRSVRSGEFQVLLTHLG